MPSNRRIRFLFYIVLAGVVTLLFFTSHMRQNTELDNRSIQDFYHKTVKGMDRGAGGGQKILDTKTGKEAGRIPIDKDVDGDVDSDDAILAREMAERLRAAEQQAKDLANAKAPNKPDRPSEIVGVGSSAGGQEEVVGETDEEHEVEVELDRILRKAPVIIFSKSYCPYSKRAKGILLEKYHIDPVPYVVELDEHPLGPKIQDKLGEMTGRRTVPNIMISGKSIGGCDDIVALDGQNALVDKITATSAQKLRVEQRSAEGEKDI